MIGKYCPCLQKEWGMGEQGNYRLVGLTLMLGKIIEQIIKWLTCEHLKNNALINRSQHRDFVFKNKSCQTKLNSFFEIGRAHV